MGLIGFGLGLVSCNYASFIVMTIVTTYNVCNNDTVKNEMTPFIVCEY